ncbi:hypothetical protein EYF80_015404 [Liparis tanakae]|uniref:Uncharacterized protein n=1 Tax=Liparis tanakae TaxID=230148 RepID=A0A4Z2I9A8_9TELE|nr:hypothetical protein EYF80_015404 [Liparis tanakae]
MSALDVSAKVSVSPLALIPACLTPSNTEQGRGRTWRSTSTAKFPHCNTKRKDSHRLLRGIELTDNKGNQSRSTDDWWPQLTASNNYQRVGKRSSRGACSPSSRLCCCELGTGPKLLEQLRPPPHLAALCHCYRAAM